jgi:hypothetical protein
MSQTTTCPNCLNTIPGLGSLFNGNFQFTNVSIGCPYCGYSAPVKDGNYLIFDGVIKAFTAPGMTREKLRAAKSITDDASSGVITTQEAIQRLEIVSATLAKAVPQTKNKTIDWGLLLAILTFLYTFWNDYESDADAQAALAESRKQTAFAQRTLAEIQAQSVSLRELKTTPASRLKAPAQTNGTKNRHERRKQNAIQNRAKHNPPIG